MRTKKISLILLCINLFVARPMIANAPQKEETSFVEAAAWCAVGAGAIAATVVFASVIIPPIIAGAQGAAVAVTTQAAAAGTVVATQAAAAGTVIQGTATVVAAKTAAAGVAIKGAATVVAAKAAAAAPIAMTANTVIFVGHTTKKLVYQSPDEELESLKIEEALELNKTKLALQNCINQHRMSGDINSVGLPTACNELALLFTMLAENKIE